MRTFEAGAEKLCEAALNIVSPSTSENMNIVATSSCNGLVHSALTTVSEKTDSGRWKVITVQVGFDVTRKGERSLVINGFKFTKSRDGMGGRVFWRCSRRECKATAVTVSDHVEHIRAEHCHDPPVLAEFFADKITRCHQEVKFASPSPGAPHSGQRARRRSQMSDPGVATTSSELSRTPVTQRASVEPQVVLDSRPTTTSLGTVTNTFSCEQFEQVSPDDCRPSRSVRMDERLPSERNLTAQTLSALLSHIVEAGENASPSGDGASLPANSYVESQSTLNSTAFAHLATLPSSPPEPVQQQRGTANGFRDHLSPTACDYYPATVLLPTGPEDRAASRSISGLDQLAAIASSISASGASGFDSPRDRLLHSLPQSSLSLNSQKLLSSLNACVGRQGTAFRSEIYTQHPGKIVKSIPTGNPELSDTPASSGVRPVFMQRAFTQYAKDVAVGKATSSTRGGSLTAANSHGQLIVPGRYQLPEGTVPTQRLKQLEIDRQSAPRQVEEYSQRADEESYFKASQLSELTTALPVHPQPRHPGAPSISPIRRCTSAWGTASTFPVHGSYRDDSRTGHTREFARSNGLQSTNSSILGTRVHWSYPGGETTSELDLTSAAVSYHQQHIDSREVARPIPVKGSAEEAFPLTSVSLLPPIAWIHSQQMECRQEPCYSTYSIPLMSSETAGLTGHHPGTAVGSSPRRLASSAPQQQGQTLNLLCDKPPHGSLPTMSAAPYNNFLVHWKKGKIRESVEGYLADQDYEEGSSFRKVDAVTLEDETRPSVQINLLGDQRRHTLGIKRRLHESSSSEVSAPKSPCHWKLPCPANDSLGRPYPVSSEEIVSWSDSPATASAALLPVVVLSSQPSSATPIAPVTSDNGGGTGFDSVEPASSRCLGGDCATLCNRVEDATMAKVLNTLQQLTAKLNANADPPEVIQNCRAIQACLETVAAIKRSKESRQSGGSGSSMDGVEAGRPDGSQQLRTTAN